MAAPSLLKSSFHRTRKQHRQRLCQGAGSTRRLCHRYHRRRWQVGPPPPLRPPLSSSTTRIRRGCFRLFPWDRRPTLAFFPHPTHISRHFDEDERTPFEASSSSRRPATRDGALRYPATPRSEPKRPISSPVVSSPVTAPATAPGSVSSFPPSSNVGNAWGLRKEVGSESPPSLPNQQVCSTSRLAQGSAVEKVSSVRWHSRPPEVEIIKPHETEELSRRFGKTAAIVDDIDRDCVRERPTSVSPASPYGAAKARALPGSYTEMAWDQQRAISPMYPEMKEKRTTDFSSEGVRAASIDVTFSEAKLHQQGTMEVLERPQVKLLPRRKPLESPNFQTWDVNDND